MSRLKCLLTIVVRIGVEQVRNSGGGSSGWIGGQADVDAWCDYAEKGMYLHVPMGYALMLKSTLGAFWCNMALVPHFQDSQMVKKR